MVERKFGKAQLAMRFFCTSPFMQIIKGILALQESAWNFRLRWRRALVCRES
jgi:hypothetical protein